MRLRPRRLAPRPLCGPRILWGLWPLRGQRDRRRRLRAGRNRRPSKPLRNRPRILRHAGQAQEKIAHHLALCGRQRARLRLDRRPRLPPPALHASQRNRNPLLLPARRKVAHDVRERPLPRRHRHLLRLHERALRTLPLAPVQRHSGRRGRHGVPHVHADGVPRRRLPRNLQRRSPRGLPHVVLRAARHRRAALPLDGRGLHQLRRRRGHERHLGRQQAESARELPQHLCQARRQSRLARARQHPGQLL